LNTVILKKSVGALYVISAPSGAGKTSLVKALIESTEDLCVSISHTTRAKRNDEVDGVNYYFVSKEKFQSLIKADAFLEYANVFQQDYYGTTHHFVQEKLSQGIDVILEIDWQGAAQIRQTFKQVVTIFILPPSCEALMSRLYHRASDNEKVISERMAQAKNEMSHYQEFDYVIINDQFETALVDLKSIIRCGRLRQTYQQKKYGTLINQLLG
jgi:guanylate kinase